MVHDLNSVCDSLPCKLSCDFSELTILYVHIFLCIFMTNKSVMTVLYVNKYLSVMGLRVL